MSYNFHMIKGTNLNDLQVYKYVDSICYNPCLTQKNKKYLKISSTK